MLQRRKASLFYILFFKIIHGCIPINGSFYRLKKNIFLSTNLRLVLVGNEIISEMPATAFVSSVK